MLSGTVAGSYESESWSLHEEREGRKFVVRQEFSTPFAETPQVVISFSELDAPSGPLRARVYATDVGRSGFTANIETWADSRLYAAVATWIAY